ncbi:hypothetical protein, partial [Ligilactobacillus ruminis]|uniref:hypothetical protein n=1 Tax=Ligilactobacillus ruminis TaxID=1623 RepID=UPI003D0440A5
TDFVRHFSIYIFCQMQCCASPAQSMSQDWLTGKLPIFEELTVNAGPRLRTASLLGSFTT